MLFLNCSSLFLALLNGRNTTVKAATCYRPRDSWSTLIARRYRILIIKNYWNDTNIFPQRTAWFNFWAKANIFPSYSFSIINGRKYTWLFIFRLTRRRKSGRLLYSNRGKSGNGFLSDRLLFSRACKWPRHFVVCIGMRHAIKTVQCSEYTQCFGSSSNKMSF